MQHKTLVSIIVPVYNLEGYITKCIESLKTQTYQDLEIILIDDGSRDKSGIICDDYAKKDQRVKVIHTNNGGQSRARNMGIDVAQGEYIMFVDGDDFLDTNCIQWCMEIFEQNPKIDIVSFAWNGFYENDIILPGKKGKYILVEKEEFFSNINIISFYVWNKMYRKSVIADTRFIVGRLHEEITFLEEVFDRMKLSAYSNSKLYNYLLKRDNATFSSFDKRRMYVFDDMRKLINNLSEKNYVKSELAVTMNALDLYQSMYFNAYSVKVNYEYLVNIHQEFKILYSEYRKRGCASLFRTIFYFFPYSIVIKKRLRKVLRRK